MDRSSEHRLKLGDFVCLFSEDAQGLVFTDDSSIKNNGLKVKHSQKENDLDIPDVQVVTFQVQTENRYKLAKQYRKLRDKHAKSTDEGTAGLLHHAKAAAEAEEKDNQAEQSRLVGRPIRYGDLVQLRHMFTDKFVTVSCKETSTVDKNKMLVKLDLYNSKSAHFRLVPGSKVKSEGDYIEEGDQVALESMKTRGNYIHVTYSSGAGHSVCEVNCGIDRSVFTVIRHATKQQGTETPNLTGGSVIQFHHKDLESYITAEGMYGEELQKDAHLRVHNFGPLDPRSLYPPRDPDTYFQVVPTSSPLQGDNMTWKDVFYLRHMPTRLYLSVNDQSAVRLVTHPGEDTQLRFYTLLHKPTVEYVYIEDTIRILHIQTGTWLYGAKEHYSKVERTSSTEGASLDKVTWERSARWQIKARATKKYPDAFILKQVSADDTKVFNYMVGMVPFLREAAHMMNTQAILSVKETIAIEKTLQELVDMSEPVKNDKDFCKQNTMRGAGVIDLLFGLLKTPLDRKRVGIFQVVYRVLLNFTGAQSLQNNIYCAPWLGFLKTQLLLKNDLGYLCCQTMIELIRNNRVVIDSIDTRQVAEFVAMTREHKHHYLLDLLSALCVCNDIAIIENQTLIAETMVLHTQECLFHIQLGRDIGHLREKEHLFISTDNRVTWLPLTLFLTPSGYEYKQENYLYFEKQMGLFKRLAFGHNEHILELLTNRKDVLPWEVAFRGLTSALLPDSIRTLFCDVIIHLFVENAACPDRIHQQSNNFIYRQISPDKSMVEDFDVEPNNIDSKFPELKPWLQEFFDSNPRLIKAVPDRNTLIAEVMKLVLGLVSHNYMGSGAEIHDIKSLVVKYTEGIHDAPCLPEGSHDFSRSELRDVMTWSRTQQKYAADRENDALILVKREGLNLMKLLLEVQTTRRQKYFLAEFKNVHNLLGSMVRNESHNSRMVDVIINPLDGRTMWMEQNAHLRATLEGFLKQMLDQTDFLGPEIPDILLELSKYEYCDLRLQCIPVTDSFFSSKQQLLSTTLRTQIITSPASEHVQAVAQKYLPAIQTIARTKVQVADLEELCAHLQVLTSLCHAEENPELTYTMSQDILVNNGILELLIELVTTEEDASSKERESANASVSRACFLMLRTLTRRNEHVKQWMFDHLHTLLFDTQVTVPECALALQETFRDNTDCCMRIDPSHIEKIVQLAGRLQSHQWIAVLTLLVRDEATGTIFGRNQSLVMKMLMQNFEITIYPMKLTAEERLSLLMGEGGDEASQYYVELVSMLATCAQGGTGFISSVSQKLLPLAEVLDVLTSDRVEIASKAPFCRYLVAVYLSETDKEDFSLKEILLNSHLWSHLKYLLHFPADVNRQSDRTQEERDEYDQYLQYMLHGGFLLVKEMLEKLQTLEYEHLLEAEDLEEELSGTFVSLCKDALQKVTSFSELHTVQECWNSVSKRSRKNIKYGQDEEVMTRDFERMGERVAKNMNVYVHDAHEMDLNQKLRVFSQNLVHLIEGENTVGVQLGVQDRGISHRAYVPLNSDVRLPLGADFHRQVACYTDPEAEDSTDMFGKTRHLIEWIERAGKQIVEKPRSDQAGLHLKCIQILRALLYNQIRQLPPKWEEDARMWQGKLQEIKQLQDTLDDFGLIKKMMPLMDHSGVSIGKHVMALIDCMLFNANRKVQFSIFDYFMSTKEEVFFRFVRTRLQLATLSLKQRPNTIVKTELKVNKDADAETVCSTMSRRSSKTNECFRFGSLSRQSLVSNGNNNGNGYTNGYQGKAFVDQTLIEEQEASTDKTRCASCCCFGTSRISCLRRPCCAKQEESEYDFGHTTYSKKDIFDMPPVKRSSKGSATTEMSRKDASELGYTSSTGRGESDEAAPGSQGAKSDVEVILRVLGGLCDGQNREMQNHMREQLDNVKSVNLVAELTHFVSVVYTRVTPSTIPICTQLFSTLHEICEGNQENRATLIDNKIIDYINLLLRKRQFEGCDADDILDLKAEIAGLLYSLIEENGVQESETAMDVCQTMAVDDIRDLMTLCYAVPTWKLQTEHVEQGLGMHEMELLCSSKHKRSRGKVPELKDLYEKMTDMGYLFYCILARLVDLKPDTIKNAFPFPLQLEAFNYFKSRCRTVEILKDGHLQKKHFRVKNQNLLREEIKELVKWEVDRSSPTSKLRDLLSYSKDILKDIDYQKMIINHRILAELAKKWSVWHYISVLLSLVITVIMLTSWRSPYSAEMMVEDLEEQNRSSIPANSAIYKKRADIGVISEPVYDILMIVFGAIHCACSAMLLFCYLVLYHPVFPSWMTSLFRNPRMRRMEKKQKAKAAASNNGMMDETPQPKQQESKLEVKFFSSKTLYYLAMPTMSVLGFIYYGYFYAFHLLGIVNLNPLLQGVINAITYNGRSLIWVGILGVIVIYIYTLFAFAFFREMLLIDNDVFCHTLSECFVSILRYGTIGDITDAMPLHEQGQTFERFSYLTLFHILFFIIFTTIGLNIIFGIIVDTFSEIRDKKWIAEQDMNDICFICSKDSFDFEHNGKGFEYHVREEHHMWNYVFYLIYLHEVEEKDYTSLDMYVAKLVKTDALDFFPMNCALGLNADEEDKDADVISRVNASLVAIEGRLKVQEVAMKKLFSKFDNKGGKPPGPKPSLFKSQSAPPPSFSGPPSVGSSEELTEPGGGEYGGLEESEPTDTGTEPTDIGIEPSHLGTEPTELIQGPDSDETDQVPSEYDDLPDEFPPPLSWDEDETSM